ncbi:adenosylcobinamide-GDP ribazoletransferase [Paenibacillus nanensis]|uniref:Adenosylcobinamide-GDP ribazoletransferase n=1 Tax=Paenibacillus nanensis TaxID=393251 RepID=A0A3A1V289_9BACL|nr:adenosylcobinamide-GDP ribazoletransferase [Paenibacillus nanensis]RIX51700.1 adenosylcobinamide-GDP ribazoletransferase [Paenibacillus nanensis]
MGVLKLHMQAAIAAIQFLTRFPVPVQVPFEKPVLTRSVIYFPLAGGLIGAALGAASWLLSFVLPPWPAAVIVLALWAGLTGGLHLDGWMDTADGVLSHRSRERMLEIMKDSRVGAMGVIAGVLLLLLKAALLAELLKLGDIEGMAPITLFILGTSLSRAWMAAAIAGWPPARHGEGMGNLFSGVNKIQATGSFAAAAILSFIALMINYINHEHPFYLIGIALMAACFMSIVCGWTAAAWLNRKLGGLTGDTYGAMNEFIETVLLLAAIIWAQPV